MYLGAAVDWFRARPSLETRKFGPGSRGLKPWRMGYIFFQIVGDTPSKDFPGWRSIRQIWRQGVFQRNEHTAKGDKEARLECAGQE